MLKDPGINHNLADELPFFLLNSFLMSPEQEKIK